MITTKPKSIILEPFINNNCPTFTLKSISPKKVLNTLFIIVLSSNHIIQSKKEFKEVVIKDAEYMYKSKVLIFGIIPTSP